MTVLPNLPGMLKGLKKLDLSDNQLTELPAWLGKQKRLTDLDVSGNPLSVAMQQQLKTWLPKCKITF
ncbi:leucine-rich repeat domain-containing protein [Xanthocytophaga flava]|uniref:leucine-rich repeat domain-containing protein n=1 Tax=Xanthocytophaga flava TaxID=3048013 RepID=UPI0028D21FCF|nr:leucine-rich repeat domain-containing protein [Xanthocytophaga flavus]